MDRTVETALGSAGDFAGAAVWRRACRELAEGARVGVVSLDGETAGRLAKRLRETLPLIHWVTLALGSPEENGSQWPPMGTQDALLSVHSLLWATSVTAPLGARERQALDRLAAIAPRRRALALTDLDLLARISDHPEKEAGLIGERLAAIVPEGWEIIDEHSAVPWVRKLVETLPRATRRRRVEIARTLLDDARSRTELALVDTAQAESRCHELLDREDAALTEAKQQGERVAAHLLASMRRRTETLLVDLRTFLHGLEAELPDQIAALDDARTARRVLPHWLDHIIDQWMSRHLADWRAGVFVDIAEVRIGDEEAERAELLPPFLHPAPLRNPSEWGRRLAVTAALGSGAMLAVVGLWIPGALIASGGLVWSAWSREDATTEGRERLLSSARTAVRRLAGDAERMIGEQIAQIETELQTLGDSRASSLEQTRAETRSELVHQSAQYKARSQELRQIRDALAVRLEAIAAESS